MTIPLALPADLDGPVRDLYKRAVNHWDPCIEVSPENLAAANQLSELGLARVTSYSSTTRLYPARLHPAYAAHRGRGDLYVEVAVQRHDMLHDNFSSAQLLLSLHGASFDLHREDRGIAIWKARCVHQDATDHSHDAVRLADLDIAQVQAVSIRGWFEYRGWLTDARFWPHGTDVLAQPDEHGDVGDVCRDTSHDSHPFGPYLPEPRPETIKLRGAPVLIRALPIELVGANGEMLDRGR